VFWTERRLWMSRNGLWMSRNGLWMSRNGLHREHGQVPSTSKLLPTRRASASTGRPFFRFH